MRRGFVGALLVCFLAAAGTAQSPDATWGRGSQRFSIATGSLGETGLLERLATEFVSRHDATVDWYRAGSGRALEMLKEGEVDMVLAHAPAAEQRAVADGWATGRELIGSNEFWIVGPDEDPADVRAATDAADAMRRIADAGATFVSRGDQSGTHQREQLLWERAGISPAGDWYVSTHAMMTTSLKRADALHAYFLTDSSTFIVQRSGISRLTRLFRGDPLLSNPYHTLYATKPTAGAASARQFGQFLVSHRGQELMRKYGRGRYGEPLYLDAAATRD